MSERHALKRRVMLSLLVSPVPLGVWWLAGESGRPSVDPWLSRVYLPSAFVGLLLSDTPHSINGTALMLAMVAQTAMMVFAVSSVISRLVRARKRPGAPEVPDTSRRS